MSALQNVVFFPTAEVRRSVEIEREWAELEASCWSPDRVCRVAMHMETRSVYCTYIDDQPLYG